VVIRLRRKS